MTKIKPKPNRKLYIKLNGNSTIGCKINLKGYKKIKLHKMLEEIASKLNIKTNDINKLRLFNFQGLEIYKEDLNFIKNGETLYISRGEDFKIDTYYSEYKIAQILG